MAKTVSRPFSLSNSSLKPPFFAVLMYSLYDHLGYFKFIRPVFPDYLSVSYDYVYIKLNRHYLLFCNFIVFRNSSVRLAKNIWNLTVQLQPLTKYLRQTLVFMWNSTLQEKVNFDFPAGFCHYWQNFHFGRKTGH